MSSDSSQPNKSKRGSGKKQAGVGKRRNTAQKPTKSAKPNKRSGAKKAAKKNTSRSSNRKKGSKRKATKKTAQSRSSRSPHSKAAPRKKAGKRGKRRAAIFEEENQASNSSIEERFLALINARSYRPKNKSEMARELDVGSKDRAELREVIKKYQQSGVIEAGKHGRFRKAGTLSDRDKARLDPYNTARKRNYKKGLSKKTKVIQSKGILSVGRGMEVYFEPETDREDVDELFVSQRDQNYALPGDTVEAEIKEGPVPPHWRRIPSRKWLVRKCEESGEPCRWAKIHRVLQRSTKGVVGSYRQEGRFHGVAPDSSAYPEMIDIHQKDVAKHKLQEGDKVLVLVEDWDAGQRYPRARILKRLGQQGDAGVDILSIFYKHGLRADFPVAVTKEAEKIPNTVQTEDLNDPAEREDWREQIVITIDPVDARDFDDAISVVKLSEGGWRLAVHIADVSHYVRPGSALDKEAVTRGNNTYLADRVVPMLPEKLSNGICSLVPEQDRLTACAVIDYDSKGKRKEFRFCKAVIHSAKRLTYEQAMERIDSPNLKDPVDALIAEAWTLASLLRQKRFKNGALDLEMPEIRAVLNEQGQTVELKRSVHDESHQLVEEFMLAANQAVALHLKRKSKPALYRVHEDPDADRLFELRDLLATFGIKVGDLSAKNEVQKALNQAADMPQSHAIKLAVLKSMKRAVYGVDPLGHYGLAFDDYAHFTSPIRRYADLLIHRALFADTKAKGGKAKTASYAELAQLGAHLSKTERASSAAEMESQKLKQLEYFLNILHEKPHSSFAGVITEIQRMGIFVELNDSMLRGLVRPSDLPHDMQRFDAARKMYLGSAKNRQLKVGDSVKVKIIKVDAEMMRVDFSLREWE